MGNRFDLIRVVTKSGMEGFSAGPAIANERKGLGELIAPYLLGVDALDIKLIQQRLREIGYLGIRAHWIEPAFWDLKGKLAQKPLFELLGGTATPVTLYASTGELKSPEDRVEEVQVRYDEGFRHVKIRVHDFESPPSWTVEKRDALLDTPFHHNKMTLFPSYLPGLGFHIDPQALKIWKTFL